MLARFCLRMSILAVFAAFGSIGFGRSLAALLWMSTILSALIGNCLSGTHPLAKNGPPDRSRRPDSRPGATSSHTGIQAEDAAAVRGNGWWGKKDSNLRSHKTADLQSAPFATRDTPPLNSIKA